MHVLVEALLEDPAPKIVGLALHRLAECLAKLDIIDAGLARRLGKPGGLETPRNLPRPGHEAYVALGAIDIKLLPPATEARHEGFDLERDVRYGAAAGSLAG